MSDIILKQGAAAFPPEQQRLAFESYKAQYNSGTIEQRQELLRRIQRENLDRSIQLYCEFRYAKETEGPMNPKVQQEINGFLSGHTNCLPVQEQYDFHRGQKGEYKIGKLASEAYAKYCDEQEKAGKGKKK